MAAEKTLSDAFYETLKDVYFAEKQSVKVCKKSAKAATLPELKKAFEAHGEESATQVERLVQVFEILGKPARAKTCEAMQGIMSEMEEDLEDFGGTAAADAVIIGCGQAIEHYEMARYGLLKTWATRETSRPMPLFPPTPVAQPQLWHANQELLQACRSWVCWPWRSLAISSGLERIHS